MVRKTPKVMVVDDEDEIRKSISIYNEIEETDYEMVCYPSGDAALEAFDRENPDLVILDWIMPGRNGIETLKEIKAKRPGLPVIMLTAKDELEDKVTGLDAGADDYVPKPFNLEELFARVRSMLRIKDLQDKLEALSTTDELTGLNNRRELNRLFELEFQRARRYGLPISCLMIDIDHFKKFNDTHGHRFGDKVLAKVAAIMEETSRDSDIVGRYGGEEFLAVLPHTGARSARACADKIRSAVEAHVFKRGRSEVRVTVSIGVCTMSRGAEGHTHDLVSSADGALYKAKERGRNRVVASSLRKEKE